MKKQPSLDDLAWAVGALRAHAAIDARPSIQRAIEYLDRGGVFAAIDEATETGRAVDLLVESAARSLVEADRPNRKITDPMAVLRATTS